MTAIEPQCSERELPARTTPWALENLPPFPAVATRLLHVLAKEDVHVDEVSKIVAAEPVFTTRVLQMANSPLFAIQQQVKNINNAIVLLGLERVRAITVTRAMGDYVAPAINVTTLRLCWRNSLAGAILAEKLARLCRMDEDFAYIAGLLRDIGRLALLMKYPREFENLVAVTGEQHYDLTATERELFDIDHCEAGVWILKSMPLPQELCDVVAHHHEQLSGSFGLVHLVRTSDRMADSLGFSIVPEIEQPDFAQVVEEFKAASGATLEAQASDLTAEVTSKIQSWN